MAVEVITNAVVVVNSKDLSDHTRSVKIDMSYNEADTTAMGDSAKQRKPGLGDHSIEVEFLQDYAAASVDATLFPLVGDGTGFVISVWPNGSTSSATNPKFDGTFNLYNYNPMSASVGEVTVTPVLFKCNGSIARSTA